MPSPNASGLPEGVTVAITQQRSDVAERQAEVQIHNGTTAPLRVGAVRLADPRFAEPAERVVDRISMLAAGATVNVRVQLPAVSCSGGGTDAAVSTVTVDYDLDGRAGSASAPAREVFPFLEALHRRECVAQRAAEIADIEWAGFTPSASGAPAALALRVEPHAGEGAVEILDVRETNLLSFPGAAGASYPIAAVVRAGDEPVEVAVPLVPARCDPHAVQEDKRGTVFTLDVSIDGAPGQFTLAAAPDLKARLLTWVTQWCGEGAVG